ncbi:MAG: hypothetical protein QME62_03565, partial [Armatimonadota bacterium]|nr:hypothetical protein [Armatimonadota bacterium]
RAMSSWSVKLALDGFTYSLVEGRLGFAPKLNPENYCTAWNTGTGWGIYSQDLDKGVITFEVLYGSQKLTRLEIADLPHADIIIQGPDGAVSAQVEGQSIIFDEPLTLKAGEKLVISAS